MSEEYKCPDCGSWSPSWHAVSCGKEKPSHQLSDEREKEKIWAIIKPHMWRVAHFDADQAGDYQRELEDLFEAARKFERETLSPTPKPQQANQGEEIKEQIRQDADYLREKFREFQTGTQCQDCETYFVSKGISHLLAKIDKYLALNITGEGVTSSCEYCHNKMQTVHMCDHCETHGYPADVLEGRKDLIISREGQMNTLKNRIEALEKERAAFKETSDLWWQCYQDRCEGALTEVTHLKRAEKERDELRAKLSELEK